MTKNNAIVLFSEQKIRRLWHNEEWWFSVVDVVGALTGSPDASAYWRKLKQRLNEEESEVVTNCHGLKLPKAEPFFLSYQRRLASIFSANWMPAFAGMTNFGVFRKTAKILSIISISSSLFTLPAHAENSVQEPAALPKQGEKMNLLPAGEIPSPPVHIGNSVSYMGQFCANTNPCQNTQKQQVCERFRSAAVNVQQVLDRAIACEVNAAQGVESDCDGLDAGRLDLLKQYWQDEDMSYTILFLPDMVQNAAASCPEKNQAKQVEHK